MPEASDLLDAPRANNPSPLAFQHTLRPCNLLVAEIELTPYCRLSCPLGTYPSHEPLPTFFITPVSSQIDSGSLQLQLSSSSVASTLEYTLHIAYSGNVWTSIEVWQV